MATDRALWITWYDLPDGARATYLDWLHGNYIPAVLERAGYLWAAHYATVKKEKQGVKVPREQGVHHIDAAAVPAGEQYVLIFAAADTAAFGACAPGAINAALPAAERKLLALRGGERMNIMVEAARVDGPERPRHAEGMQLAPCIQLGQFNCTPAYEEEMMAWYTQWRMDAMSRLPGCIRTRKLASVAGWAKHAILYEFTSLAARNEHFSRHEAGRPDMVAWGDKIVNELTHAPGSPNLGQRIWPPIA